jgi:capsular exopolysaccharide synthesis family protein
VPWNRGLLDVLSSGPIPPNPSELLGSHQMSQLLTTLAARYDVILLDAPPLLPVTDAAVLASLADGAILITRHGVIKKEQVSHAVESLRQVNARLLGVVMNFAPVKSRGSGYGYGYGYGYSAEYGDKESSRGRLAPETASAAIIPTSAASGDAPANN